MWKGWKITDGLRKQYRTDIREELLGDLKEGA
jgi:hypothetical protein